MYLGSLVKGEAKGRPKVQLVSTPGEIKRARAEDCCVHCLVETLFHR